MSAWTPDPTFYPTAKTAMEAPREELAYVALLNPNGNNLPDALAVLDVNPDSSAYGQVVGRLDLPYVGDELHHFGWNACSAALCPTMPHPHLERRYLLIPGLRSSRMYVVDTKPDPRQPRIVKIIEPEELEAKSGYSRPHTVHC
ncbi:MAG: selenium-binding family protein, partial [Chloroflexota bacterium]|nr:selenium-binding family protein [Chloroflexota bacterium]